MNKTVVIINRAMIAAGAVLLAASLVFYLICWDSLPDNAGVHFAADGSFDVYASRFFGFYPHVVGGVFAAGLAFSQRLIAKKKTGLDIDDKGESVFKAELSLTLSFISMVQCLFFANWSRTVALQIQLDTGLMSVLMNLMLGGAAAGAASQIVTCRIHGTKKRTDAKAKLDHRLNRLIPWGYTAAGIVVLIVSWNRHPGDPVLYFDPAYKGLAYFANFDTFLDKRLLIIPHAVSVLALAALEIITVRAEKSEKADKNRLILLIDRLKLICGSFFLWWSLLLDMEERIGVVSVILFGAFCIMSVVLYAVKIKKKSGNE